MKWLKLTALKARSNMVYTLHISKEIEVDLEEPTLECLNKLLEGSWLSLYLDENDKQKIRTKAKAQFEQDQINEDQS